MREIAIIIPARVDENIMPTFESLQNQTYKDFEIIFVYDIKPNSVADIRNYGAMITSAPYLFFLDADVILKPTALEKLYVALKNTNEDIGFAYCGFRWLRKNDNPIVILKEFDIKELKKHNYISTMSLIKSDVFHQVGGWDREIKRLMDWDLWLRVVKCGYKGICVPEILFETNLRQNGLTSDDNISYQEAQRKIKEKHNL